MLEYHWNLEDFRESKTHLESHDFKGLARAVAHSSTDASEMCHSSCNPMSICAYVLVGHE